MQKPVLSAGGEFKVTIAATHSQKRGGGEKGKLKNLDEKKLLLTRQYAQMLGGKDTAALTWNKTRELLDKA